LTVKPVRFEVGLAELRGIMRLGRGRADSHYFLRGLIDLGWSPESAREFLATVRKARGQVLASEGRRPGD
jgi:hypothetical protein